MPYYNKEIEHKLPELVKYFKCGILDESKNIGHCILLWGADIKSECELALEIARLLNCKKDGDIDCDCLNCRWVREQTHPAVKIYTRLDFKEANDTSSSETTSDSKKNINVAQARSIISELSVTSDYHRVYIFCDRDEDGNLLPLNKINFPEVTSNALLKTFEEPPENTTFIFLTNSKTDIISTIVSRAETFFVPSKMEDNQDFSGVEGFISQYWNIDKNMVLDFEAELVQAIDESDPVTVFTQIQNYMKSVLVSNFENKKLFNRIMRDIKYVEDAKRQVTLTPPMNTQTVCDNLCFKMILH